MFKSVFASFVVLASFVLTACGSNADSGEDLNIPCPSAGTGCKAEAQGQTCSSNVCCGGAWLVGTSCPTAPAPSATTTTTSPAPTASTVDPTSPAPTNTSTPPVPPPSGARTLTITFKGVIVGSTVSQRYCEGGEVVSGDRRPDALAKWNTGVPGVWHSFGRDVVASSATYTVSVPVSAGYGLRFQCYDVVNGTVRYGVQPTGAVNVTVHDGAVAKTIVVVDNSKGGVNGQVD